jgi:hypothetical protein
MPDPTTPADLTPAMLRVLRTIGDFAAADRPCVNLQGRMSMSARGLVRRGLAIEINPWTNAPVENGTGWGSFVLTDAGREALRNV